MAGTQYRYLVFLFVSGYFAAVGSSQVDFFRFHLQWEGGECKYFGCCKPPTLYPAFDFVANRLLPATFSSRSPPCRLSPFDINSVSSFREELQKYMPSYKCPGNDGSPYWDLSWRTDGICSGFTQTQFFQKVLYLRKKANMMDLLDRNAIQPSKYQMYNIKSINKAPKEVFAMASGIFCLSAHNEHLIWIALCVDKTATNFIPCSSETFVNCSSQVYFDHLTADMYQDQYLQSPGLLHYDTSSSLQQLN